MQAAFIMGFALGAVCGIFALLCLYVLLSPEDADTLEVRTSKPRLQRRVVFNFRRKR